MPACLRTLGVVTVVLCLGVAGRASAQSALDSLPVRFDSMGDFGGVGLLQMPTARMAPDGQFTLGYSRVWPYERYAITIQALPWLETTLRYTNVLNRLYGPASFSGDQTLKDRGFDVKLRLIEENEALPEIAVGLRDLGGTGLFSGEYIVASKRWYDFDFMLGMGWGYLGSRGQFRNPLRILSDRFKERKIDVGQGGDPSTGAFFRGERASLLAGLSYRTPIEGLTLKLELDGNDYSSEPQNNDQRMRSPFNFGATYALNNWLDLSVGFERGDKAMLQLTFKENLKSNVEFPKFDPSPRPVRNRAADAAMLRNTVFRREPAALAPVALELEKDGFQVDRIATDDAGRHLTAYVSQRDWLNQAKAAGRAARAVASIAPESVEKISVANIDGGIETHRLSLLRRDLELSEQGRAAAEDMWHAAGDGRPGGRKTDESVVYANPRRYPGVDWFWTPGLRQHIGGPDNPYFYQIYLQLGGELQLARGLSLTGAVGLDVYNNLDDLRLASDSALPHVRSDIKDYLKAGKNNLARLHLDYAAQLGPSLYGKFSAGYLEEMFAGVGGQLLYRPYGKRWSIGGNLFRARQRDYDQRFALRDYTVNTGHLEFQYRWPIYNIQTTVSAGQYLAGDRGVTFEISRNLENGTRFGAWFTRTNVSAEQFGEGSFDKGIFVSFPLDRVSLLSSRNILHFAWRPLTRDGGQKLTIPGAIQISDPETLAAQWPSVLK